MKPSNWEAWTILPSLKASLSIGLLQVLQEDRPDLAYSAFHGFGGVAIAYSENVWVILYRYAVDCEKQCVWGNLLCRWICGCFWKWFRFRFSLFTSTLLICRSVKCFSFLYKKLDFIRSIVELNYKFLKWNN